MILTHHSFPFTSPSLTKYHKTVNLTIIDLIGIDKTSKHLATKINFYTLSRSKLIILRWKMSCYNFKIFENFSKKGGAAFGSRRLDIESSRDRFLHTGGLPKREGWGSVEGKEKKKKERHGRCSRGVERGVAERKWKPASLLDPLQRFYLPFRQCQPRGFIKQFLVAAAGEKSAWKIDSFRHGGCLRTRFLREPPFPPAAPPQDHLYYRYRDGRESPENVIKSVSTAFYRAHTAGSCCAIVLAPQTNVWMPPRSNENPDFEIVRSDGRETPRSIPPYL